VSFPQILNAVGGGQSKSNMQPFCVLQYIIRCTTTLQAMTSLLVGGVYLFAGAQELPMTVAQFMAPADGQTLQTDTDSLLEIRQIISTTFGVGGNSSVILPDLRGRIPVAPRTFPGGVGPGVALGAQAGEDAVSLGVTQVPAHTHFHSDPIRRRRLLSAAEPIMIAASGGGQPLSVVQPVLDMRFLVGIRRVESGPATPTIGFITLYAGDTPPTRNWVGLVCAMRMPLVELRSDHRPVSFATAGIL